MSDRNLEVWQLGHEPSIRVHRMTVDRLPRVEMYEEESQIRRSAKSTRATIVEGRGRRVHRQEFIQHPTYALASCDETMDHPRTLMETSSLEDKAVYETLHEQTDKTGREPNLFRKSVQAGHRPEC